MSLPEQLAEGLAALELDLPESARQQLLAYVALLQKWNRVQNLTAVREPRKMISHHLLDCLAVLPHLHGDSVVDVGSGAGLPGVALAVARPGWRVSLLDSNHKKAAFLRQALIELQLDNADVICERLPDWRPPQTFDIVISRGFADIPEFATVAGHLLAPSGALVAMKGLYPYEEIEQLPARYKLREVLPLTVPGLNAQRHLVIAQLA
jgi:16S rRNA (guanine527-N7)-methyltransferase